MATHSEVISRFANRTLNKHTKEVSWHGHNVSCEGDVLLSYGWWPIAFYAGEKDGQKIFLKQGDRYSSSTSGHQGATQRTCKGPTVSFSALTAAGIEGLAPRDRYTTEDKVSQMILDYTEDSWTELTRETQDSPWQTKEWQQTGQDAGDVSEVSREFVRPEVGMMIPDETDPLRAHWHVLGAVLIRDGGRRLLCSIDEGTYFVSQIPQNVSTVKDAFDSLMPYTVARVMRDGRKVLRQGEWYFLPEDGTEKDIASRLGYKTLTAFRKDMRQSALPTLTYDSRRPNLHVVRHILRPESDGGIEVVCTGHVYHRDATGRRTRDHRTLTLSGFYTAVRNLAVRSWSALGRVD